MRREIGELGDVAVGRNRHKLLAFVQIRQRYFDGGHVRALHEPLVELDQLVDHQHERRIDALDQRILGPGQKPHQARRLSLGKAIEVARGHEKLRVLEEQGDALATGRLFEQISLDERLQAEEHLFWIARPGRRFSPAGHQILRHQLQPLRIVRGQRPQTAAQVVAQHEVPASEDLAHEEIGEPDVAICGTLRKPHQIVHVAMQHEHASRAGEVEIGQLLRPRRIPIR